MNVLLLFAALARALEVSPLFGAQLLGGQYFHRGERSALSGNFSGVLAPAIRLNDSWAVLPALQSSYQGTKSVVDLVGSGTLFQEQMDHRASVRAVWSSPTGRWRLKPNAGVKQQFLKETRDEKWGAGLFDYRRWSIGAEAEFVYDEPYSVRGGADYYSTTFVNYTSLESRAPGLSRELAGDTVLDSRTYAFSLGGDLPLERLILEAGLNFAIQHFPDQNLVDERGALFERRRTDAATQISLGARMPGELNTDLRLLGSLDLAAGFNNSNQNSYDARAARHFPLFYNHREVRLSPGVKALIGPPREPVIVGLSGSLWTRLHPHREAQDETGSYMGRNLSTRGWTGSASLQYPMAKHFSLMFSAQFGRAYSNQRYEQYYRYNYTVANYLFGFTYDY